MPTITELLHFAESPDLNFEIGLSFGQRAYFLVQLVFAHYGVIGKVALVQSERVQVSEFATNQASETGFIKRSTRVLVHRHVLFQFIKPIQGDVDPLGRSFAGIGGSGQQHDEVFAMGVISKPSLAWFDTIPLTGNGVVLPTTKFGCVWTSTEMICDVPHTSSVA